MESPVAGPSSLPDRPPSLPDKADGAPPTPTSPNAAQKRANPLTDLISSEQVYVDHMSKIIRKVASAWSKHNFPPKALDLLFRAIEGCFRANKGLLAQLVEIGPSPASPKALGDLLMRWVDEIEPAYSVYATSYRAGFDDFEPVQKNARLPDILAQMPPDLQSLDSLFQLPYHRLHYYKRLYSKLLRSTTQGRSDHRQLLAATEKLDDLLARCESVLHIPVQEDEARTPTLASSPLIAQPPTIDKPVPRLPPIPNVSVRDATPNIVEHGSAPASPRTPSPLFAPASARSSQHSQSAESQYVDSRTSSWSQPAADTSRASTATQDFSRDFSPNQTASSLFERSGQFNSVSSQATSISAKRSSVDWLESRLDTARALDVFSMKPKKCRLQINPPGLNFTRNIRHDGDVAMSFQLSQNSIDAQHRASSLSSRDSNPPLRTSLYIPHAHIFLLTDLFLVCERIPQADMDRNSRSEADMWLLFPPLSGKHLAVEPIQDQEGRSFQVIIMRREVLEMTCSSRAERDLWMHHFEECMAFGSAALPAPTLPLSVRTDTNSLERKLSSTSSMTVQSAYPQQSQILSPPLMSPYPVPSPSSADSRMSGNSISMRSSHSEGTANMPRQPFTAQQGRSWSASAASGYATLPAPADFRSRSTSPLPTPGYQQYPNYRGPSSLPQSPVGPSRRPSVASSVGGGLPPGASRSFSPTGGPPPMGRSQGPLAHHPNGLPQSLRKNGSRSTGSLREYGHQFNSSNAPPLPNNQSHASLDQYDGYQPRHQSFSNGQSGQYRSPSATMESRSSTLRQDALEEDEDSPPPSPVRPDQVKNQLMAQMKCKVFLQTSHQQWKALGTAKLMLYLQMPGNGKQLVCQQENKDKTVIISTMVLTDGVERMGKTGVAIELSDQGARTGIVYMLQLKTEQSATGLFNQFLLGSDRKSAAA